MQFSNIVFFAVEVVAVIAFTLFLLKIKTKARTKTILREIFTWK